jgi:hypothetical protein
MEVLNKDILSPWLLVDAFKIPVSAIDAIVADKQVVIDAKPGEPVPPAVHHDYLDAAISRLRTTNGYFYSQGLGRTNLLADFAEELTGARLGVGVDPPPAEILWFPPTDGAGRSWCRVVNGCFPVSAQMRALLPPESWVAHFQLTIPVAAWYDGARSSQGGAGCDAENAEIAAVARAAADSVTRPASAAGAVGGSAGGSGGGGSSVLTAAVSQEMAQARPVAIILPGTGEHGFERRRHVVSYPLARLGVASIILDGPYYGARRPATQSASRLPALMDLCVLGRATIDEAVALARWAEAADADTVDALAQGRLQEVNDRASAALKHSRARKAGAEAMLQASSGGGAGDGAKSAGGLGLAGSAPARAAASRSLVAGPVAPAKDIEDAPRRPAVGLVAAPVVDGGSDGEEAWPVIPERGLVDSSLDSLDGTATTSGDGRPGALAASKRLHSAVTMRDLRLERDRISASIAYGAVAAASGTVGSAPSPRMAPAAALPSPAGAKNGGASEGASPAADTSSRSAAAPLTAPAPSLRRGFGAVVLAGTSMGGLHAAMTAACDPTLKAGVVSWVGPPSASGVFTLGALAPAVDWRAITADTRGLPQRQKGSHAVSFSSSSSSALPPSPNLRGAPSTGGGDAPFGITLPEDVAAWMPAVLRDAAMRLARHSGTPQAADRSGGAAAASDATAAAVAVAADPRAALSTIPAMPALPGFGVGTALDAAGIGSGRGSSAALGGHRQPAPLFADPSTQGGLSVHWQHVVDMEARLASVVPSSFLSHNHQDDVLLHHRDLAPASAPLDAIACVARLLRITDITNFGPPRLPQAVAFITATHDRYVPRTHSLVAQWRSMLELWPGCTIQQVVGGHVSACLFHSDTYCGSIVAVIRRLRRELQ